jgi:hypothetical protein
MTDRASSAPTTNRESASPARRTLTPTQLAIDLGEGWTVASALAHMGFWDRWQAERWSQMLAGKWSAEDESVIAAEHLANEALHPYWAGLEAEGAGDRARRGDPDRLADRRRAGRQSSTRSKGRRAPTCSTGTATAASTSTTSSGASRPPRLQPPRSIARSSRRTPRAGSVLGGLSAADLRRSAGAGDWTVGQIVGHLTFWDRFLAARWRAAMAGGDGGQPTYLPHELADLLNDGLPPTWLAFASGAGSTIFAEAIAAAEEVDRIVAGLPESTPVEAILNERPALLDRSIHRISHLDQIERALGR